MSTLTEQRQLMTDDEVDRLIGRVHINPDDDAEIVGLYVDDGFYDLRMIGYKSYASYIADDPWIMIDRCCAWSFRGTT